MSYIISISLVRVLKACDCVDPSSSTAVPVGVDAPSYSFSRSQLQLLKLKIYNHFPELMMMNSFFQLDMTDTLDDRYRTLTAN